MSGSRDQMHRRTFIKTSAAAAVLTPASGASARGQSDSEAGNGGATAFVWRPMISTRADLPTLNGHIDAVPDIVGRLGSRIDLAIFTDSDPEREFSRLVQIVERSRDSAPVT